MHKVQDILRRASISAWTVGRLVLFTFVFMFMIRDRVVSHVVPERWPGEPSSTLLVAAPAPPDASSVAQPRHADDAKVVQAEHGASATEQPAKFPVIIRRPAGPPIIEIKEPDPLGRVGRLTCSTCHSVRPPQRERRRPADLKEFHQNMEFAHGQLACYSCHNPDDSDTLKLADGAVVRYPDVMDLCSQCHGIQARDYARGLHGGMTGYWDLSRGQRTRNNCVDCHDPHVPAFPRMLPTFKPRDRFLDSHGHDPDTGSGDAKDREAHGE